MKGILEIRPPFKPASPVGKVKIAMLEVIRCEYREALIIRERMTMLSPSPISVVRVHSPLITPSPVEEQ